MADDLKDVFRKSLGYHLQHAARLHRAAATKRLSKLGLHHGQEQILVLLMKRGDIVIGDLAEALDVRPPTMTKSIARLEAQGFVQRKDSASDARSVTVMLTPEGRDRAAYLPAMMEKIEEEMFSSLDDKDQRRLRKALRRIIRADGDSGETDDQQEV